MNKRVLIYLSQLVMLSIINHLASNSLSALYLFEWSTHNNYWYCCIFLITILFLLKKDILATIITYSNILGIFLGQIFGDIKYKYDLQKINPELSYGQQADLYTHDGASIWFSFIGLTLVIYGLSWLIQCYRMQNHK